MGGHFVTSERRGPRARLRTRARLWTDPPRSRRVAGSVTRLLTSRALPLALSLAVLALPLVARAQDPGAPHARRVEVTFLLQPSAAAVLVSEHAVWAPLLPGQPLSVCAPGQRCVPVTSAETCAPPRCPGSGTLLVTRASIREDASDFPESLDDWKAEVAAMRLDPLLAPLLASYLGAHPDDHEPEPVLWMDPNDDEELSYEFRAGMLAGGLAIEGAAYWGAEFMAALRYSFHGDDEADYDGGLSVLDTAFGDSIALEARVAVHDLSGDSRLATSLGMALSGANIMDGGRFRISSVLSAALPEMGVFFRRGFPPAFYARMSFPLAWAITNTFDLELRPSVTIIDAWAAGPTSEVLVGASLGLILH